MKTTPLYLHFITTQIRSSLSNVLVNPLIFPNIPCNAWGFEWRIHTIYTEMKNYRKDWRTKTFWDKASDALAFSSPIGCWAREGVVTTTAWVRLCDTITTTLIWRRTQLSDCFNTFRVFKVCTGRKSLINIDPPHHTVYSYTTMWEDEQLTS